MRPIRTGAIAVALQRTNGSQGPVGLFPACNRIAAYKNRRKEKPGVEAPQSCQLEVTQKKHLHWTHDFGRSCERKELLLHRGWKVERGK